MSKNSKIKTILGFFILLMIVLLFVKFHNNKTVEDSTSNKTSLVFKDINFTKFAKVTKYFVYGTHFNIEAEIEIPKVSGISIYSTDLLIKDIDNKEFKIDSKYKYKDNILSFSTIDMINTGLSLENLDSSNYYLFLKVIFSNNEVKYYSFENATKYEDISYYSLTKNKSNNLLKIGFDNYNDIPFLSISVSPTILPEKVYDITIDAAHRW